MIAEQSPCLSVHTVVKGVCDPRLIHECQKQISIPLLLAGGTIKRCVNRRKAVYPLG